MNPEARRVGRYRILRVLGRGGMATVYLARQTDLDRDVALKELALFADAGPDVARRFLREARLAGSFSHPNIVTVHEYLENGGTPYIAMEYLPRGSLRPYVGRMSLAQVANVLTGVLGGLAHAEEREVVHRDLKPENIMVTAQGGVKIADFGIAKATSATQTANLTTTGTTLGTPRYMSPERALGQAVGPWSDLYSVGAIAFELLVGHAPFHDTEEPMAILMRQINDPVPPVHSLVPDVDPELSHWIERLLEKDPRERTASAAAAADELDEIVTGALGPRWMRGAALPARPGDPTAVVAIPTPRPRSTSRFPAAVTGSRTIPPATRPLPRDRRRAPPARARRARRRGGHRRCGDRGSRAPHDRRPNRCAQRARRPARERTAKRSPRRRAPACGRGTRGRSPTTTRAPPAGSTRRTTGRRRWNGRRAPIATPPTRCGARTAATTTTRSSARAAAEAALDRRATQSDDGGEDEPDEDDNGD